MISAERLEQLRTKFDTMLGGGTVITEGRCVEVLAVIDELIAARTRIASLEQERDEQGRTACELFDECKRRRLELDELRAQGLSQEDREAAAYAVRCLDAHGKFILSVGGSLEPLIRRLGGQT